VSRRALQREGTRPGHLQANQRSDGRRAPLVLACIAFCVALPILRVHQNLELFKRHGLTPPFPPRIQNVRFWTLEETMNFDEVIQLQF
jgi:hypothetical protein